MKIEEVCSKIPSHGLCAKIARSPKYIRHFINFGQRALADQNKSLLDLHHCHALRMRQRERQQSRRSVGVGVGPCSLSRSGPYAICQPQIAPTISIINQPEGPIEKGIRVAAGFQPPAECSARRVVVDSVARALDVAN